MDLIYGQIYKVIGGNPSHGGRSGKFQFLGDPKCHTVVLSDVADSKVLFAVSVSDIEGFDPGRDRVVHHDHVVMIGVIDKNEEVFEIKRRDQIGEWAVMWVYFPQCPMSHKVMVYKGNAPTEDAKQIDPHFGREGSPLARFPGTEDGWDLAKQFMVQQVHNELAEKRWERRMEVARHLGHAPPK